MLASIFSKTKPINYIILTLLVVGAYFLHTLTSIDIQQLSGYDVFKKGCNLILLLLMMYLSQFIVTRNNLVRDHAYVPLFFVSFLLLFPESMDQTRVIVSAYFIMLALRRILSLHSLKNGKEKIFDASLWILIASLFQFWSILFLVILFISMLFFVAMDYKNWVIFLLALGCVFTLLTVYLFISDITYIEWLYEKLPVSFDFMYFDNIYQNIALAVFGSMSMLFFSAEVMHLPAKTYNLQSTYKKVLLTFLIGLAVYVVSNHKTNGLLLFSFFPLSVLGANFVDRIEQKWIKETVVYSLVITGLIFFISQLFL